MAKSTKSVAVDDDWDSGKLGRDEKYVKRADAAAEAAIDEALGLQMISIRLPKRLIEDLKFIGKHNAVGYQPLMRDVLMRFAKNKKMAVLREQLDQMKLQAEFDKKGPAARQPTKSKKAA